MPFVDEAAGELNCKVVYWGPALGGKATSMQHAFTCCGQEPRTPMVSLETDVERTLSCSFTPGPVPTVIDGSTLRVHLYCVPGNRLYFDAPKLILKGASAVIFVADSQPEHLAANVREFDLLRYGLHTHGRRLESIPLVFQYNKVDLPDASPPAILDRLLEPGSRPRIRTVATSGPGSPRRSRPRYGRWCSACASPPPSPGRPRPLTPGARGIGPRRWPPERRLIGCRLRSCATCAGRAGSLRRISKHNRRGIAGGSCKQFGA